MQLVCAEARSVVVTQPNNKLSRVLKTMLKELPAQMRAINAAGLASSLAMSDVAAAVAGPAAADAAREQLQRRLQMIRALQVGRVPTGGWLWLQLVYCMQACWRLQPCYPTAGYHRLCHSI